MGGNEDTTREGPRVNEDLVGQWEGRGVEGRPLVRECGKTRTGTWHSLSLEGDALASSHLLLETRASQVSYPSNN